MLVNLEDFKHLNSYYKRPAARGVVFRMYASNCQVCGRRIESIADMWVGHRTPQSHWEYFDAMVEGRINIDNLLNLQPEHRRCNLEKSNFSAQTATLFQSALDLAAKEVLSLSLEEPNRSFLGLELQFDLSPAVKDGLNPKWLWLDKDLADDIVQVAFKSASSDLPDAYLPRSNIASVVIRAPLTEGGRVELGRSIQWAGRRNSAFDQYMSKLWEQDIADQQSPEKSAVVLERCKGWYVFPHGTDLKNLLTQVYCPNHRAAMNLQRFSSWIESGQGTRTGSWVCKGAYANVWSLLFNEFHELAYEHGPIASFEVVSGRAKLTAHSTLGDEGDSAKKVFRRLFEDENEFRKGRLHDGDYELFDRATVRSFVRKKERIIRKLANAPSSRKGEYSADGGLVF